MPNWCENNLKINGKKKKIKSFMKKIKDDDGEVTFEKLLPMPDDVKDWYHWNINNWGTKWGGTESLFDDDYVSFDTAWSPPIPFLETVSTRYPNLEFTLTYLETGLDFCGLFSVKNGKILIDLEDKANSNFARKLFEKEYIDEIFEGGGYEKSNAI